MAKTDGLAIGDRVETRKKPGHPVIRYGIVVRVTDDGLVDVKPLDEPDGSWPWHGHESDFTRTEMR